MTKKEAWLHIGMIVAAVAGTPLVAKYVGPNEAFVYFIVLYGAFCYWPTTTRAAGAAPRRGNRIAS